MLRSFQPLKKATALITQSRYKAISFAVRIRMDHFNNEKVHIGDRKSLEEKISNIIKGGKEKLQVIADFDRTLSKAEHEGRPCACTYNAIDESRYLDESYRKELCATRDHYLEIETNPNLTIEQKTPFMVEWWTKAHDLLTKCKLNKDFIHNVVKESKIILRDGCGLMFEELHKSDVPLLIFSAGVGDIIQELLEQQYTVYNNMKIVSNFMDFNSQGDLVGFKGDIIHVFNKNESAVCHSDYFENLSHRENIILMGDSLGDLNMADGCVNCKNILKIGFLNGKVDQLLERYKAAYDIVLVEDQTMDVANSIIKRIL